MQTEPFRECKITSCTTHMTTSCIAYIYDYFLHEMTTSCTTCLFMHLFIGQVSCEANLKADSTSGAPTGGLRQWRCHTSRCTPQTGCQWFGRFTRPIYCLDPRTAWILVLLGSSYYLDPRTTWILVLPGSSYYLDPHTAWILVLPGSSYYLDPRTTWILVLPGSLYYLDPHTNLILVCYSGYLH